MRILFDRHQGTPVPLRPYLEGFEIRTAAEQGWDRLRNGDLIVAAEGAGFEILLTTDKNIRYQQNLTERTIAIVLLSKQQWPQVRPHVCLVVAALAGTVPGSYIEVDLP